MQQDLTEQNRLHYIKRPLSQPLTDGLSCRASMGRLKEITIVKNNGSSHQESAGDLSTESLETAKTSCSTPAASLHGAHWLVPAFLYNQHCWSYNRFFITQLRSHLELKQPPCRCCSPTTSHHPLHRAYLNNTVLNVAASSHGASILSKTHELVLIGSASNLDVVGKKQQILNHGCHRWPYIHDFFTSLFCHNNFIMAETIFGEVTVTLTFDHRSLISSSSVRMDMPNMEKFPAGIPEISCLSKWTVRHPENTTPWATAVVSREAKGDAIRLHFCCHVTVVHIAATKATLGASQVRPGGYRHLFCKCIYRRQRPWLTGWNCNNMH